MLRDEVFGNRLVLYPHSLSLHTQKPCYREQNWPKERGPTETQPGRKTETDRVFEEISEGSRLAESGGAAPRGVGATSCCQAPSPLSLKRLRRGLESPSLAVCYLTPTLQLTLLPYVRIERDTEVRLTA